MLKNHGKLIPWFFCFLSRSLSRVRESLGIFLWETYREDLSKGVRRFLINEYKKDVIFFMSFHIFNV